MKNMYDLMDLDQLDAREQHAAEMISNMVGEGVDDFFFKNQIKSSEDISTPMKIKYPNLEKFTELFFLMEKEVLHRFSLAWSHEEVH